MYGRALAQASQRQFGAAFRNTTPQFGLAHPQKQYNQAIVFEEGTLKRRAKHPLNEWFYKTVLQKNSTYFCLVGVLAWTFDVAMKESTAAYVAKFNAGRSYDDVIKTFPEIPPGVDLEEEEDE